MANPEDLLSLAEAAQISGYHQDYLGALARQGKLHAVKVGRNWTVSRGALNEFLGIHENAKVEELGQGEMGEVGEALMALEGGVNKHNSQQLKEGVEEFVSVLRKHLDRSHDFALLGINRLHRVHVAKDFSGYAHPSFGKKYSSVRQFASAIFLAIVITLMLWIIFLAWVFLK